MRTIKFFYTCPECEHEQDVSVIPGTPARTCGPPENCDPGDGDEVDSGGACEKCGCEFEEDKLFDKASDIARDQSERDYEE